MCPSKVGLLLGLSNCPEPFQSKDNTKPIELAEFLSDVGLLIGLNSCTMFFEHSFILKHSRFRSIKSCVNSLVV